MPKLPLHRPCPRAAWTLMEMLVVICVVGLLSALILTAVTQARTHAHRTQCASNVRQLGLLLNQFVTDHKVYPLAINWGFHLGEHPEMGRSWNEALAGKYTAKTSLWDCPSASRPDTFPSADGYEDYGYNSQGFAINGTNGLPVSGTDWNGLGGNALAMFDLANPPKPILESEVVQPSEMIALGDGMVGWKDTIRDGTHVLGRTTQAVEFHGSSARSRKRHQGSANIVFADGHLERISLESLFAEDSDLALRRWNRNNQPVRMSVGK